MLEKIRRGLGGLSQRTHANHTGRCDGGRQKGGAGGCEGGWFFCHAHRAQALDSTGAPLSRANSPTRPRVELVRNDSRLAFHVFINRCSRPVFPFLFSAFPTMIPLWRCSSRFAA